MAPRTEESQAARPPSDLPPHRSLSQLKNWRECGEAYRLQRIAEAPSKPGWYFPGGTAVHSTIEQFLRQRIAQ